LSDELTALVQRALEALQANATAAAALAEAPAEVRDSLPLVLAGSDFVAQLCASDATLLAELLAQQDLQKKLAPGDFAARAPAMQPERSEGNPEKRQRRDAGRGATWRWS